MPRSAGCCAGEQVAPRSPRSAGIPRLAPPVTSGQPAVSPPGRCVPLGTPLRCQSGQTTVARPWRHARPLRTMNAVSDELERRDPILAARRRGGRVALRGCFVLTTEPIDIDQLTVGDGIAWRAPVCADGTAPAFRPPVAGTEPERCARGERPVDWRAAFARRRLAFASGRCSGRYHAAAHHCARRTEPRS